MERKTVRSQATRKCTWREWVADGATWKSSCHLFRLATFCPDTDGDLGTDLEWMNDSIVTKRNPHPKTETEVDCVTLEPIF